MRKIKPCLPGGLKIFAATFGAAHKSAFYRSRISALSRWKSGIFPPSDGRGKKIAANRPFGTIARLALTALCFLCHFFRVPTS
jgi:hypothetical protein